VVASSGVALFCLISPSKKTASTIILYQNNMQVYCIAMPSQNDWSVIGLLILKRCKGLADV
jgi:hypothetical protein